jgi:hypothetical protein
MLVDLSAGEFKRIDQSVLTLEEREALDQLVSLKRKTEKFWGL